MPNVSFYHSKIESPIGPHLTVSTGMDEISWGYQLNTAVFPTYGGEVVQILSTYIDDLEVSGTVGNYAQMERIYKYFAYYLQIATQGRTAGSVTYNQEPMVMSYPERGWNFKIMVKGLPGFKYGTSVVAPQWRIQAHIVDDSNELGDIKAFTHSTVLDSFLKADDDDFDLKGRIGFKTENPFSAPGTLFGDSFNPEFVHDQWQQEQDRFNEVINAYLGADLNAVSDALASRPTYKSGASHDTTPTTQVKQNG